MLNYWLGGLGTSAGAEAGCQKSAKALSLI